MSTPSRQNILIRVQSPDGAKRVEISPKANLHQLFQKVQEAYNVDHVILYKERNYSDELLASLSHDVGDFLKHGDVLYLKTTHRESSPAAASSSSSSSGAVTMGNVEENSSNGRIELEEDAVDLILEKSDGLIKRERDSKLCRHTGNSSCVHCSPIEPYDEAYLKEHNIKHLSFHSFIRKQKSGIDRGKYVAFEEINCKIKTGCREHPPWPKGICSKCQPSAIALNRQIYRHIDNVMFENTSIVERFLNYWRSTGHQRVGWLYGTYELNTDVPLGIRAHVAAIYEPPQQSSPDSIELLTDEGSEDVEAVAKALGLKKVGWIFSDLITEDSKTGTVKHLRGIETHFLTAKECIMAGYLQNCHPNACKYSSSGTFGSKFATVCVTGDKTNQVHMEGYAVSAQCMALVKDNCLVPTKDAPEMGYVRESTEKQYVPDVYYKEKDQYGNEVQRLARPLPVEYLLVDVPASTPLQPQYTFTKYDKAACAFPVENRYLDGHLQDFNSLSAYLMSWPEDEFLEALSDFHLLVYLYKMDMLPMKAHMHILLEAVRTKNNAKAMQFKNHDVWKTLESLIKANTTANSSVEGAHSSVNSANSDGGAQASSWTCKHCTFINRGELGSCEMCSLPR